MTTPLVTTQKVAATVKSALNGASSHVEVSGFYASHPEIEIWIGKRTPTEKKVELMKIAEALAAKNIAVFIWKNDNISGDIRITVFKNQASNPELHDRLQPYSEKLLDTWMAVAIRKHAEAEAKRKAEQAKRAHEREVENERRMGLARKQNPSVQITILEQNIDQSQGVAFTTVKDNHGFNQYLLMQWNYGVHGFMDTKKTYNVHVYHAAGVGSNDFGGSTSCTGAESLEDAVLSYVASWHVGR